MLTPRADAALKGRRSRANADLFLFDGQSPQHQKRRGEAGAVGFCSATGACESGAPLLPFLGAPAGGNAGVAFGVQEAYLPPANACGSAHFAGAGQVSVIMHNECRVAAGAQHDMHFMFQPAFRLATCHIT